MQKIMRYQEGMEESTLPVLEQQTVGELTWLPQLENTKHRQKP